MRRLPGRRKLSPVLSVGGISIAVDGVDPSSVPDHLHPYSVNESEPMVRCRGELGPVESPEAARVLFDSGGVWRVEESPGGIRLVLRSGDPPGRDYHVLDLDQNLTRGRVRLDPGELEDDSRHFLLRDPLHELWTSFLLMRGRGLLLHGCALLLEGRVHVFLGESGAGKSTLGKVIEKHGPAKGTILSDDRLVVRPHESGYQVYGTPWHGEAQFASHLHGPLESIWFLDKAPLSEASELSPVESVDRLFRVCFLAGWPRTGLDFVLGMCQELGKGVPCRLLRFRPDETALVAAGVA